MTKKLDCSISRLEDSYEIEIVNEVSFHQIEGFKTIASKFAIITHDSLKNLYGEAWLKLLLSNGLEAYLFSFPKGEEHKNREEKNNLENQLFEQGLGRDSCIIALGGGVVTDLAGYVAATYCRGIPLMMVPTTLLGMVDASIGGKNGVNVSHGKNMIGTIYQPKKVIIDLSTLKSLPKKELSNGIVEIIKHGLIADVQLFNFLESNVRMLLTLDVEALEKAIYESCRIKIEIVEQDEKEKGKRHLLNFGHTVGHALEKLTKYSIAHGEAVAIGLLVESYLSVQMGFLKKEDLSRIKKILLDFSLPLCLPAKYSIEEILEAMTLDKKSVNGQPRFVMIDQIGSSLPFGSSYCTHVDEILLKKALQWMNDDLCCH